MRLKAASREYFGNIVTALLLLLLLALWQFSSSGVVRGGDDDGSGIGGTGRIGHSSGESGFGGTGLKPFLTINNNQEVEILRSPALRVTAITETRDIEIPASIPQPATPVASIARVTRDLEATTSSAAIDISEAIQSSLDSNALYFEQLTAFVESSVEAAKIGESAAPIEADTGTVTTWDAIAQYLSRKDESTDAGADATQLATADIDEETTQLARPEPLQRPQLPPVQRVSPLQRAAILPPRVQPMRL